MLPEIMVVKMGFNIQAAQLYLLMNKNHWKVCGTGSLEFNVLSIDLLQLNLS